jgi:hypothetical protein
MISSMGHARGQKLQELFKGVVHTSHGGLTMTDRRLDGDELQL